MSEANTENKIHVLMIGPSRSVHGGISEVVNTYYQAGLGEKVDITYIASMKEGSKLKKLFVAIWAYIRFLFCINSADLVHVHAASDSSFIRKSFFIRKAYKKGKKIVLHQHGGNFVEWYAGKDDKGKAGIREVLDMADKMLVLAPVWVEYFGALTDANKLLSFSNSIFIPEYEKTEDNKVPIAKEPHSILYLGRLCETKGIKELAASLSEVIQEYPDAKLYLAGNWEDEGLKELFSPYKDNVKEMGWVSGDGKRALLDICEVFVLPTYFEGQPVSILEAMAAYCAVVASDVGGIPMMIEDGCTGLLIAPKDKTELSNALKRMLGDEELRYRLTANAREVVVEGYDINQTVSNLVALYTALVGTN